MPTSELKTNRPMSKSSELEQLRQDLARLRRDYAKVAMEKSFLERATGDLNFHNNAHDGVVYTDDANRVIYANPYFLEMMGIKDAAEILNQPFPDYMWNNKADAPRLFKDIHADGFVRNRELAFYDKEGKAVFAMCSGVATRDDAGQVIGTEIMFCNITSKRAFQAELVEQHALLDAMLESTPDPVFIFDAQLVLNRCNPAAEELFPPDERKGVSTISNLFGQGGLDAETTKALTDSFSHDEPFNLELFFGMQVFDLHAAPLKSQQKGWVCVLHDITARKQTEESLQYVAFHDVLTKLPNRAYFIEKLERFLRRARREPHYTFALLFIDLDRLKQVNDSHGHQAGDKLLIEFARRLEACIRPGDLVCRLGGDEFAVFLDNIPGKLTAEHVAQRIDASLEQPFEIGQKKPVRTTASIGIAFSDNKQTDLDVLLRQADGAMYQVKEKGGNGFLAYAD